MNNGLIPDRPYPAGHTARDTGRRWDTLIHAPPVFSGLLIDHSPFSAVGGMQLAIRAETLLGALCVLSLYTLDHANFLFITFFQYVR